MGKLRVYCLKTLNKLSIYPLGNTPSAPSEWGELVTPLVDRKEEWWFTVMGVGLDPELTKWSVHSGPVNFLTGRGYKEHHWLVIPHQPLWLSPIINLLLCLLIVMQPLLTSSPVPLTSWVSVGLPSGSILKRGAVPLKTAPLPPSCTMKRNTE